MIRSVFLKTASLRGYTWSRYEYMLRTTSFRCFADSINQDNEHSRHPNKIEAANGIGFEHSTGSIKTSMKPPSSRNIPRNPEELYQRYLMTPDQPENARLLRVAIIGAPNSGKSSLVNSIMGWKVTGVSKKVHTTKVNTNTMFNIDNTQVILVDTPGVINRIKRKKHRCDASILVDPERSVQEADVVGVVVDMADRWTRIRLDPEILQILYLHKDVPTFLVLNKIDEHKHRPLIKQQILFLDIIRRLTAGVLGGQKFGKSYTERNKEKGPDPLEDADKLFDKLEKKYGRLKVTGKSDLVDNPEYYKKKKVQNSLNYKIKESDYNTNQLKGSMTSDKSSMDYDGPDEHGVVIEGLKDSSCAIDLNEVSPEDGELSYSREGSSESFEQEDKLANSVNGDFDSIELDLNKIEDTTDSLNIDNVIREPSYQSEHLASIMSKPPSPEFSVNLNIDMDDNTDWADKVAAMNQVFRGVRPQKAWEHFDQVFLTSAVDGTGIDDLKNYLVSIAKPRDWVFHSSVVTDQHPHDIAKMCVIQTFLDYLDNYVPYILQLEIMYWDIDEYGRLNVAVDAYVTNSYELKLILRLGARRIKEMSGSARQALMDAFQCDVKFKLAIKQRKRK